MRAGISASDGRRGKSFEEGKGHYIGFFLARQKEKQGAGGKFVGKETNKVGRELRTSEQGKRI